jgi:uncharacterized protein (DUF885 family)
MSALFEMLERPGPTNEATALAALARLEAIPGQLLLARTNLERPSRVATEVAREDARGVGAFLEQHRTFLERYSGDPARTRRAVDQAISAYRSYARWLGDVLLPRSTASPAIGRDLFRFLLEEDYALPGDIDAVERIGREAFDDARSQLADVAAALGHGEESWPSVGALLKGNHPSGEDLVPAYQDEVKRAKNFLVTRNVVPLPPSDTLVVRETPDFARATTEVAYDMPPPFETGSATAIMFVTPPDARWPAKKQEQYLREHNHGDIVDTVAHEAYPGHHLQVSFARRHPSAVRRVVDSDILCEGWALYAEQLMSEEGYFTSEERFFQLEWRLVRAARVLIDVGIHTGKMSLEQARSLLVDEVHLEPVLASSEVRRYALSPTQPLSYVVGESQIRAMRERWLREGRGDVRAFHEAVLSEGSIPPAFIERAIF